MEPQKIDQRGLMLDTLVPGGNGGHARKAAPGKEADKSLTENILQNGILIPLVVCPNGGGKYDVVDGNRRLRALRAIHGDAKDVVVPTIVRVGAGMAESLATFVFTEGLHPIDEYEGFAYLAEHEKLTAADIAKRFGWKERDVRKRLALGSLAPELRDLWRAGKMHQDAAEAFTLGATHAHQMDVYRLLKKANNLYRYQIRRAFLGEAGGVSAALKFVGRKEYEAAGGAVVEDLFSDEKGTAASDLPLLMKMRDTKVDEACEQAVADGWQWAALRDRDPTLQDRYSWESLRPNKAGEYSKADMARGGIVFVLSNEGALAVDGAWVRPDPNAKKTKGRAQAGAAGKPAEKKAPPSLTNVTQALDKKLTTMRLTAIKVALVADKFESGLCNRLASVVASMIKPESSWSPMPPELLERIAELRDAIAPEIMYEQMKKAFDAADYFASIPKTVALKAIEEALDKQAGAPIEDKKTSEVQAFALKHVPKAGWLPPQLRFAGYDGPGTKAPRIAKAAKAKPAKKAKRK